MGCEQGGILGSEEFQLVQNFELHVSGASGLGLDIGGINVSNISAADDVSYISTSIHGLQSLLNLSVKCTDLHFMTLVPEKTKLLVFIPPADKFYDRWLPTLEISLKEFLVTPSVDADHVGVVRSTLNSNIPAIQARISAHTRALFPVIACGAARAHRASPASTLRCADIYGTSVLFSGLASLVLNKTEVNLLTRHLKKTLIQLQRLHRNTGTPAVYFMSGVLPAKALLDIKILNLFGMISRLGTGHILHKISFFSLTNASPHSWLTMTRKLFVKYDLGDPLTLLLSPPAKEFYKRLVKTSVTSVWHTQLKTEAQKLSSLKYLHCDFLPLGRGPHLIWRSCNGSLSSVHAATIHAKLLCGTYRCDALIGKFTGSSIACSLEGCDAQIGDAHHLLSGNCPALVDTLATATVNGLTVLLHYPHLHKIVCMALSSSSDCWVALLMDPGTQPFVISYKQAYGVKSIFPLYKFCRTYIWAMHRKYFSLKGLSKFLK